MPGRPIKYLVVTHHHGDHRASIRAYAERGATVVVAASAVEYHRQRLADPHTINRLVPAPMKDVSAQVVAAPRERTFGHGAPSVQILDVGPTMHSQDMLVAYVGSAKVLFTGDLVFSNSRGEPSPSSRETFEIARRLDLAVDMLVSVQGASTTWTALEASLRR